MDDQSSTVLRYVNLVQGALIFSANCLVIHIMFSFQCLQTRSNMFITSLAFVDAFVGLVEIIYGLYLTPTFRGSFDRNKLICVGMFHMFFFSETCSVVHMLLIACDRYLYICEPYFYAARVTERVARIALFVAWFISFAMTSAVWVLNTFDNNRPIECMYRTVIPEVYRIFIDVPSFYITLIPACVIYVIISKLALKHKQSMKTWSTILRQSEKNKVSSHPGNQEEWLKHVKLASLTHTIKTLKLFFVVCGLLLVCWLPKQLLEVLMVFNDVPDLYLEIAFVLGFLNSGLDVLVYPCYSKRFRSALKRTLTRRFNSVAGRVSVSWMPVKKFRAKSIPCKKDLGEADAISLEDLVEAKGIKSKESEKGTGQFMPCRQPNAEILEIEVNFSSYVSDGIASKDQIDGNWTSSDIPVGDSSRPSAKLMENLASSDMPVSDSNRPSVELTEKGRTVDQIKRNALNESSHNPKGKKLERNSPATKSRKPDKVSESHLRNQRTLNTPTDHNENRTTSMV